MCKLGPRKYLLQKRFGCSCFVTNSKCKKLFCKLIVNVLVCKKIDYVSKIISKLIIFSKIVHYKN